MRNQTKLSRAQLEACKFHGVTQYPELGVLSKLLLGGFKTPDKPFKKSGTNETSMSSFKGGSLDELASNFKTAVRDELRYMEVEEGSVVGYKVSTYDGNLEISVVFGVPPTKEELTDYEAEISLHKQMLHLLPRVEEKVLEYAYMDDQDRREGIEAQIRELQKQL